MFYLSQGYLYPLLPSFFSLVASLYAFGSDRELEHIWNKQVSAPALIWGMNHKSWHSPAVFVTRVYPAAEHKYSCCTLPHFIIDPTWSPGECLILTLWHMTRTVFLNLCIFLSHSITLLYCIEMLRLSKGMFGNTAAPLSLLSWSLPFKSGDFSSVTDCRVAFKSERREEANMATECLLKLLLELVT